MNKPPTTPPPSSEESSRADLSHFGKKDEDQGPEISPTSSTATNVFGALSSAVKGIKAVADKKPIDIKITADPKTRKKIIFAAAGAVVLLLIIGLVTIVPGQIVRSKAFAAYESGRYEESLKEFRAYLHNKSGDVEAMLYAARAATYIGEYEYAAETLNRISGTPAIADSPDFLFTRALVLAPAPQTIELLNSLVSVAPKHSGGRLLRGIMLARENEIQRAREDFLTVDSAIRNDKNYDNSEILAVNNRIISIAREVLPTFDLPPPTTEAAVAATHRLAARLNIPVPTGIYINRYIPLVADGTDTTISDDNLVGIYYALMLLADSQFNEALVEFSKLSSGVMNNSPAGSLRGIYDALTGNYAAAITAFHALSESLPSAEIFFNLANATFSAMPTEEGAQKAAELLSRAIELSPKMAAARHNRAMLRLMLGDIAGASEDLDAIAVEGDEPRTSILRLLSALATNPQDDKIGAQLAKIDAKTPDIIYPRIAHLIAHNSYEQGLPLLREAADATRQWDATNRLYARLLADSGFLMRARNILLTRAPQNSPEIRYEIALLEISSGNLAGGKKIHAEMAVAHGDSFYTPALDALLLHRGGRAAEAKAAIINALEIAETPRQKRRIVMPLTSLFITESPAMLRELLSAESDFLEPAAAAVLARLLASEDTVMATEIARNAIARYPFFEVQQHAGIALAAAGQTEEALAALQAAVKWNPVNISLLSRIRQLQSESGEASGAAFVLQSIENIKRRFAGGKDEKHSELLSIDSPKDKILFQNISRAHTKKDTPQKALARFQKLLDAAPKKRKTVLTYQRGTFLLAVGEFEKCEADMRTAIAAGDLLPERARRAGLYLSKALMQQKKFTEAAEIYRTLANENPQIPLYRRLVGGAISNAGDHKKAVAYLEKTTELFPADIESYFALAAAWRNVQNTQNTVSTLRKAARVAPLYVPIYVELSRAQQITDIAVAKENSVIAKELSTR